MAATVPMLSFDDVTVRYDGREVLEGFCLTVERGEKVLLEGRSGAGKSSLLKMALGFVIPNRGTVSVGGRAVDAGSVWAIRREIAYVNQDVRLGEGTAERLLEAAFGYRANQGLEEWRDRIGPWRERLGLAPALLGKPLADLSGGERQRVALLVAVLLGREIFLLDEVTSALDRNLKREVAQIFLRTPEWTVLAVSHDGLWQEIEGVRTVSVGEGAGT